MCAKKNYRAIAFIYINIYKIKCSTEEYFLFFFSFFVSLFEMFFGDFIIYFCLVVNRGGVKFAPQKKLVAGLRRKGEAAETHFN